MSSVGVYESAPEFIEDTVWKTLPSQHDWYPSWSKRVPELYLESHEVQYGWKDWTVVRWCQISLVNTIILVNGKCKLAY